MHKLTYRITTLAPLILTGSTGDPNMVATADFIPGGSVLGAFAEKYIREKSLGSKAHEDTQFYKWFLKGGLRFSNTCIVTEDKYEIKPNYPAPLSLQKEKDNEKELHDLLFEGGDFDILTSSVEGFGRSEGENFYSQSVKKSLNFHHKRDAETGTVEEGMIFNYEAINAGQRFEGGIYGSQDDLKLFHEMFCKENIRYIGRSRSSQYGRVKFEIISKAPEKQETGGIDTSEDISLTLRSNTIIYNENGFSTTSLKVMEKALGRGIKIEKAFIKAAEAEGFNSAWRLRRPTETCFLAGSCFLLKVADDAGERLVELQQKGLGERRGEGFGQVVLSYQKEGGFKLAEHKKPEPARPEQPVPDTTKAIVKCLAREFIKKQIVIEGLEKAKEFKNLPAKSLVSRLEAMVKADLQLKGPLEKLRKTATNQLENCHDKGQTLYEYLEKFDIELLKNNLAKSAVEELCSAAGIPSPADDLEFQKECKRACFLALFSAMRKRLKKEALKNENR